MDAIKPDDNLDCDECGRYGAVDFGERKLCPDCYETCGSCCSDIERAEKRTKD